MNNLIYTIACDYCGQAIYTPMAKMLAASLSRTFFSGETVIFHNSAGPLFRIERTGLSEFHLPPDIADGKRLKYQARQWINAEQYDWVCFLDCDMLALRNMDHLLDPAIEADILWQPEEPMRSSSYDSYFREEEFPRLWRRGANSGSFAVRGRYFHEVMAEWERIDATEPVRPKALVDQPAWNRFLFDTKLRIKPFERDEIQFPLLLHHDYRKWRDAALIHANGAHNLVKLEFLMSHYLGRFAGDPKLMLGLMDT